MDAVVDGVVSLHVPAVVVLIYTVAVNPHYRGMFFGAVEVLRDEKPARNLLAGGSGKMDELWLDELGAVHSGGHGVGEAHRRRAGIRADGVEIGAVARISVLIDEAAVAFRPVGLDICSGSCRNVGDFGVRGIIADSCDAEDAVAGAIFEVGIESDAHAVVRPRWAPCFEFAFGNLHGVAARRGNDVEMVPAVLIAEEGDPFAVW